MLFAVRFSAEHQKTRILAAPKLVKTSPKFNENQIIAKSCYHRSLLPRGFSRGLFLNCCCCELENLTERNSKFCSEAPESSGTARFKECNTSNRILILTIHGLPNARYSNSAPLDASSNPDLVFKFYFSFFPPTFGRTCACYSSYVFRHKFGTRNWLQDFDPKVSIFFHAKTPKFD